MTVARPTSDPVPAVVGGAPMVDDPNYARYRETIERDMGRFDS